MTKVRTEYLSDPNLSVDKLRAVSSAAAGMLQWVYDVEAYDRIKKVAHW